MCGVFLWVILGVRLGFPGSLATWQPGLIQRYPNMNRVHQNSNRESNEMPSLEIYTSLSDIAALGGSGILLGSRFKRHIQPHETMRGGHLGI